MTWEWIFLVSSIPLWLLGTVFAGWPESRFPSAIEQKPGQVESLEILRGVAAFVVFCAHVTAYFRGLAPGSRASKTCTVWSTATYCVWPTSVPSAGQSPPIVMSR